VGVCVFVCVCASLPASLGVAYTPPDQSAMQYTE
jgi:hypothetical protein